MIISIDIGSGIANFVHKSQASIKSIQKGTRNCGAKLQARWYHQTFCKAYIQLPIFFILFYPT